VILTLRPTAIVSTPAGLVDWTAIGGNALDIITQTVTDEDIDNSPQKTFTQYLETSESASGIECSFQHHTTETGDITYLGSCFIAASVLREDENSICPIVQGTYDWAGQALGMTSLYQRYAGGTTRFYTNPLTGVAWTWADVDSFTAGVMGPVIGYWDHGVSVRQRVVQVYVEVVYEIPAILPSNAVWYQGL
jgi:hypothetical protein